MVSVQCWAVESTKIRNVPKRSGENAENRCRQLAHSRSERSLRISFSPGKKHDMSNPNYVFSVSSLNLFRFLIQETGSIVNDVQSLQRTEATDGGQAILFNLY